MFGEWLVWEEHRQIPIESNQKQGTSDKCHSEEQLKGNWQLNVIWYFGLGSGTTKNGHWVKTKGIWTKFGLHLKMVCQYWITKCNKCIIMLKCW